MIDKDHAFLFWFSSCCYCFWIYSIILFCCCFNPFVHNQSL